MAKSEGELFNELRQLVKSREPQPTQEILKFAAMLAHKDKNLSLQDRQAFKRRHGCEPETVLRNYYNALARHNELLNFLDKLYNHYEGRNPND